jgi:hypothetical protein
MAIFNLPSKGDPNWDIKLNSSLTFLNDEQAKKYVKDVTGIPLSDLTAGIQDTLNNSASKDFTTTTVVNATKDFKPTIVVDPTTDTSSVADGTIILRKGTAITSDAEIAQYAGSTGTATRTALDAVYAPDAGGKPVGKGELLINVVDYKIANVGSDWTNAIKAAIAVAAAQGGGVVGFPPGDFSCNHIDVPFYVTLRGLGGTTARFGGIVGTDRRASTRLIQKAGATDYLVYLQGAGSGVENMLLDGNATSAIVLINAGFETVLNSVRIMNSTGMGFEVQKANNTRWRDIYIDNCGSSTLPAMRMWSKTGAGSANDTNTVDIYGLTIERSANVALEVAMGTTGQYWVEWLRIVNLHIEAPADNGGLANVDELVQIGNVRTVELVTPFIYGGPGPLIGHKQQITRPVGNGGIRLIGGTLLGSDTTAGYAPTPTLVSLISGDDISFQGTRLLRYTTAGITVAAAYGLSVYADAATIFSGAKFLDSRTNPSTYSTVGNIALTNHFIGSSSTFASVANGAALGSGAPTPQINGNDVGGRVFLGTGTTPTGGILATVTFAKPFGTEPNVLLTAGTSATAGLDLYVAATTTGFTIRANNAPAASLGGTALQVKYAVTGLVS